MEVIYGVESTASSVEFSMLNSYLESLALVIERSLELLLLPHLHILTDLSNSRLTCP